MPDPAKRVLADFIDQIKSDLQSTLKSVVLYGSAAEGRMRKTSDINLIVVLERFDPALMTKLREPLRAANAAVRLQTMFLCENEVTKLAGDFGVKFSDLLRSRVILFGSDPFAGVKIDRQELLHRIHQVLFNLTLRMRGRYVLIGSRDEQVAALVADVAGPLRSVAAAILEIEGIAVKSKKEALADLSRKIGGEDWTPALAKMSEIREGSVSATETLEPVLASLIRLSERLDRYAAKI